VRRAGSTEAIGNALVAKAGDAGVSVTSIPVCTLRRSLQPQVQRRSTSDIGTKGPINNHHPMASANVAALG